MKATHKERDESGHLYLEPGEYGFHDGHLYVRAPGSATSDRGPWSEESIEDHNLRIDTGAWKGFLRNGEEWVQDEAPPADPTYNAPNPAADEMSAEEHERRSAAARKAARTRARNEAAAEAAGEEDDEGDGRDDNA